MDSVVSFSAKSRFLEFVRSFSRSEVVAEYGSPVLDSRRNQVTLPRVIDTRSLVLSSDPMGLLGRFLVRCPYSLFNSCLLLTICSCFFVQERCLTFVPW